MISTFNASQLEDFQKTYNKQAEEGDQRLKRSEEHLKKSQALYDKTRQFIIGLAGVTVLVGFFLAFVGGFLGDVNLWQFIQGAGNNLLEAEGFWLSAWWLVVMLVLAVLPFAFIAGLLWLLDRFYRY